MSGPGTFGTCLRSIAMSVYKGQSGRRRGPVKPTRMTLTGSGPQAMVRLVVSNSGHPPCAKYQTFHRRVDRTPRGRQSGSRQRSRSHRAHNAEIPGEEHALRSVVFEAEWR